MKKLIIIGAGGFGREVLGYALDMPVSQRDWEVFGFIDDNLAALDQYSMDYHVIGSIKEHVPKSEEVFICALGDPKIKLQVCGMLEEKDATFTNVMHPSALIGRTAKHGNGLIMAPYSGLSADVKLGKFVTVNSYSGFGHDSVAENGCTLSAHCDVTGFGYLEEGVFLGSHAVVAPHVRVGKYAKVGAGSVAIKNVEAFSVVFGSPAKVIF